MRDRLAANIDLKRNKNISREFRSMPPTVPLYDAWLRPVIFVFVLLTALCCSAEATPTEPCKPDRLSVYKVIIQTYWSREKFPKHYPDWRPIAQFSKTLGRTHNGDYVLWKMGSLASKGVKDFAENSRSDLLDGESQGRAGVLDEFLLPAIPKGVGESEVTFFADGNHSKVSLITRLIPSPDWFIGIDSFDLCVLGKWLDVVTLELDPMDSGTDNGFTFTAPNWATTPQEKIYRITAQFPNHDANSFHYPHLKKLPTIATVTFVKTKEYELSQVFYNDAKKFSSGIKTNDVEPDLAPTVNRTRSYSTFRPLYPRPSKTFSQENELKAGEEVGKPTRGGAPNVIPGDGKKKRKPPLRSKGGPRHCRVGEWSEWSSCSRTCGIGEKRRTRTVKKYARKGGRPCPNLEETSWCGNPRCNNTYFDW
uniref:Spondin-2 n=1 Tax=Scolopendra viridis TaxID=118503 RepID=A0A4D5R9P3_SCOVI